MDLFKWGVDGFSYFFYWFSVLFYFSNQNQPWVQKEKKKIFFKDIIE
jgi:hypothetical protein